MDSMKKIRLELIYLRAFICVIIIVTHLLTQITLEHKNLSGSSLILQYYIRNIVIFGTPNFIVLSQLLTTLNYKKVSKHYLISRFKYIFIPYLLVGVFYCYSESLLTASSFKKQFIENVVLGQWYGYFIIIMQFFVLSYLIYKVNYKLFNSKLLLLSLLIVHQSYLYHFIHNDHFHKLVTHYYPLSENTMFLGWIFYFFLGGYIGYNYESILSFLEKYLIIVIMLALGAYVLFISISGEDYWNVTSFTYTLTLYNSLMFFVLVGICMHFKTMLLNTIKAISAFSFFIYLLHPIILDSLFAYTNIFEDSTIVFLAISLLMILGICIGVGMMLREFYIFRFVIGKQPYKLQLNHYQPSWKSC